MDEVAFSFVVDFKHDKDLLADVISERKNAQCSCLTLFGAGSSESQYVGPESP